MVLLTFNHLEGARVMTPKDDAESIVRDIKRRMRKKYSSEEKIRIVLEGLRGEVSIAELCRKEGLHPNIYYKWSKDFLEAGKKRLQGDTVREATSTEVVDLRKENDQLKMVLAELALKNRVLKKSLNGVTGGSEEL
jgi:transposase